jgi:NitT/TauT family transport system substrate-binding protein
MNRFLIRITLALAALVIAASLFACERHENKSAGPPEKVTFALAATTEAVLAEIAQTRGYYREEGLEVTPHLHPYGKRALADLLAGKADFATVAATPVMFAIMKGEKISVIATIQNSDKGNALLARRDRGILTVEDLKGKRIAATLGTISDFYLDAILGVHGISRKDIEVVDLKAEEMAEALARGDIDAVSVFNPYVAFTQKRLGDRVITFQDKGLYWWTTNVVATRDFICKNPGKVRKMLCSLVRAEEFAKGNPAEAQKIVADFSGMEPGIVRDIWADTSFSVTLEESLILSLEDESRWAIHGGLTGAREVPNYLDYIYFDGLKSVKPEAVRILR